MYHGILVSASAERLQHNEEPFDRTPLCPTQNRLQNCQGRMPAIGGSTSGWCNPPREQTDNISQANELQKKTTELLLEDTVKNSGGHCTHGSVCLRTSRSGCLQNCRRRRQLQ